MARGNLKHARRPHLSRPSLFSGGAAGSLLHVRGRGLPGQGDGLAVRVDRVPARRVAEAWGRRSAGDLSTSR
eukprot:4563957-Alexandrium_andersonii.AAC.1